MKSKIDYTNFEEWFDQTFPACTTDIEHYMLMKKAFEAGRLLGEDEGARNPYCG